MGCGKSKIVEPVQQSHAVDRYSTKHGNKDEKNAVKKDVFHYEGADDEKDILEVGLHKKFLCTIEEAESENEDDDDEDEEDDDDDLTFYSAEDELDPLEELDEPPTGDTGDKVFDLLGD